MPDPDGMLVYKRPEGVDPDILDGAFRETFLSRILDDDPEMVTVRAFGRFLNSLVLECCRFWPYRYMDATANSLRAGVGDLRHLQDFFAYWGEEEPGTEEVSGESPDERRRHRELWRLSTRTAQALKKLADEIDEEIRDWEFKPRS